MITKTVNLDGSYDALFAEIKAVTNGDIDINNIEDFFGHIEDIRELSDGKFLRLPLDEPLFEIDANTRRIEVPAEFRANGVAVLNDHLAETVFFSIDRFFDYMDLGSTTIYINWKMNQESGRTQNFILSKDIIPGSLVFGWPIDKLVTKKSGTLQFAVEFNKTDSSGLIYRFNTLASTVTIKEGLVVDENAEVAELSSDIKRMLTNSAFGEGEAAVGKATWLTGDGKGLVTGAAVSVVDGAVISFKPDEWKDTLNLVTYIDTNENVPASVSTNLIAQAYVDNQTEIRYTDIDGNNIPSALVQVDENRVLVEDRSNLDANKLYYLGNSAQAVEADSEQIADESIPLYEVGPLNSSLIYYKHPIKIVDDQEVEDLEVIVNATEADLAKWGTKDKVNLYCKIAILNVDKADTYLLKAQGEKYASVDGRTVKIGAGEVRTSSPVIVPAAQPPIDINIVGEEIEDFDPSGGENYTIDDEYKNVIYCPDEGCNLIATAEFDNFGAVQMIWQKGEFNNVGKLIYSDVPDIDSPFVLSNQSRLEGAIDSFYRVAVTNFINSTYSEPVYSADFRVSKLATPIVSADRMFVARTAGSSTTVDQIILEGGGAYFSESGPLSQRFAELFIDDIVFDAEMNQENSDNIIYEWYKAVGDTRGVPDEEVEWALVQSSAVNPQSGSPKGGLSNFKAYEAGRYRPVLKNVYNGSVYTKKLSSLWVDAY